MYSTFVNLHSDGLCFIWT